MTNWMNRSRTRAGAADDDDESKPGALAAVVLIGGAALTMLIGTAAVLGRIVYVESPPHRRARI